jgi:hypothetical protein
MIQISDTAVVSSRAVYLGSLHNICTFELNRINLILYLEELKQCAIHTDMADAYPGIGGYRHKKIS